MSEPGAPPPAVDPSEPERLDGLLKILSDLLVCTRDWTAWGYGTMTANDFEAAGDNPDVVQDLMVWAGYRQDSPAPVCRHCSGEIEPEHGVIEPGGAWVHDGCPAREDEDEDED